MKRFFVGLILTLSLFSFGDVFFKDNNLVEGFTEVSPLGGTTVLVPTSESHYRFQGAGNQAVVLPDATTLSIGRQYEFFISGGVSTQQLSVQNNTPSQIALVGTGQASQCRLRDNSTAAGSWSCITIASFNDPVNFSLIPDQDGTIDLGSISNSFRDLFLHNLTFNSGSASVIEMSGQDLTVENSGFLRLILRGGSGSNIYRTESAGSHFFFNNTLTADTLVLKSTESEFKIVPVRLNGVDLNADGNNILSANNIEVVSLDMKGAGVLKVVSDSTPTSNGDTLLHIEGLNDGVNFEILKVGYVDSSDNFVFQLVTGGTGVEKDVVIGVNGLDYLTLDVSEPEIFVQADIKLDNTKKLIFADAGGEFFEFLHGGPNEGIMNVAVNSGVPNYSGQETFDKDRTDDNSYFYYGWRSGSSAEAAEIGFESSTDNYFLSTISFGAGSTRKALNIGWGHNDDAIRIEDATRVEINRVLSTDDGGIEIDSDLLLDSENIEGIEYAQFNHLATPANPPASSNRLYFKSDDELYMLDSAGAETQVSNFTTNHAASHIDGGGDPIDGDKLEISYVPTFYVRDSTIGEADSDDDLSAHLAGIDNYLGEIGGEIFTDTIQTTDATATTIRTVVLADDDVAGIEFKCVSIEDDGSKGAFYKEIDVFRKDGAANLIQIGTGTSVWSETDAPQPHSLSITASTPASVLLEVNGRAGETVEWKCKTEVTRHNATP